VLCGGKACLMLRSHGYRNFSPEIARLVGPHSNEVDIREGSLYYGDPTT